MSNLSYESVKRIKVLTSDIISKTCTLKDVNDMLRDLSREKAEYRPEISVGPRKIRISPDEYYWAKGMLQACAKHLEDGIEDLKDQIRDEMFKKEEETEDDRDQPESEGEVQ